MNCRAWSAVSLRSLFPVPVTEAIGDRVAAVTAEILDRDLYPRRRLAALVFGDIEKMLDAVYECRRMTALSLAARWVQRPDSGSKR